MIIAEFIRNTAKYTLKKIGYLPDNSQDELVLSELILKESASTD